MKYKGNEMGVATLLSTVKASIAVIEASMDKSVDGKDRQWKRSLIHTEKHYQGQLQIATQVVVTLEKEREKFWRV